MYTRQKAAAGSLGTRLDTTPVTVTLSVIALTFRKNVYHPYNYVKQIDETVQLYCRSSVFFHQINVHKLQLSHPCWS